MCLSKSITKKLDGILITIYSIVCTIALLFSCFYVRCVPVLQLLQKGSDVNHMDREGRTALIAAAHTGCVEVVEVLLDYQANINHVDSDGRTALAVCVLSEASQSQLGEP